MIILKKQKIFIANVLDLWNIEAEIDIKEENDIIRY